MYYNYNIYSSTRNICVIPILYVYNTCTKRDICSTNLVLVILVLHVIHVIPVILVRDITHLIHSYSVFSVIHLR